MHTCFKTRAKMSAINAPNDKFRKPSKCAEPECPPELSFCKYLLEIRRVPNHTVPSISTCPQSQTMRYMRLSKITYPYRNHRVRGLGLGLHPALAEPHWENRFYCKLLAPERLQHPQPLQCRCSVALGRHETVTNQSVGVSGRHRLCKWGTCAAELSTTVYCHFLLVLL